LNVYEYDYKPYFDFAQMKAFVPVTEILLHPKQYSSFHISYQHTKFKHKTAILWVHLNVAILTKWKKQHYC